MVENSLKQFAQELRKTRETKDLSLEHVANKTRIDLKFLEAIENGDFKIIDEIYLRAFIKEYAQVLELDGNEIVKKYEAAKSGNVEKSKIIESETDINEKKKEVSTEFDANSMPPYASTQTSASPTVKFTEEQKKLVFYGGAAIVFLILLILIFTFAFGSSGGDIVTEPSYEEILSDQTSRYKESETTLQSENRSSSDSLILKVVATDTVWVLVKRDDVLSEDFTMRPGNSKEFKALRKFDLTVGNAGGINLFLNNRALQYAGQRGSVKFLIVDETGLRVVTNKPANSNE